MKEQIFNKTDNKFQSQDFHFQAWALEVWHAIKRKAKKILHYVSAEHRRQINELIEASDRYERYGSFVDSSIFLNAAEKILFEVQGTQSQVEAVLERRVLALKYRSGMLPISHRRTQQSKLFRLASQWISQNEMLPDLSRSDWDTLAEGANYPEFIELLRRNAIVRDDFFNWVLRDRNKPQLFIEFPSVQERLVKSNLSGRLGYFRSKHLNIREVNGRKAVTMLFEGKEVDILDESHPVTFRGNWRITVGEVLDVFQNKHHHPGPFELMEDGVVNWNVQDWAHYDAEQNRLMHFDIQKERWWDHLPVFETLSLHDAKERYHARLDGVRWCVAAHATRSAKNLNTLGTHAFLEVAIPAKDGKSYRVYPFGKYAKDVPVTFNPIEGMGYMCQMAPATVAYLDENVYYTEREHILHAFSLSPKEGLALMRMIQENMHESKAKNFIYQIETENCAKWVQETLVELLGNERVPNLFLISYLDVELDGVPGMVMSFVRLFPRRWQGWVLTRLHIPLGANSGVWIEKAGQRFFISLKTLAWWKDTMIYAPPVLHHQRNQGLLQENESTPTSGSGGRSPQYLIQQMLDHYRQKEKVASAPQEKEPTHANASLITESLRVASNCWQGAWVGFQGRAGLSCEAS